MAVCFKAVLGGGGGGQSMHVDTLTITTQPTKKTYIQGEKIDTTGMVVTASAYGMSGNVTQYCTVSPQILGTVGTQTITVSFGDATVTFTVTVEQLVSVSITSQPTKTAYIQGEALDLTGIAVTARSATQTRTVTTACEFSPENGSTITTAGTITIIASFNGLTDTTTVTSYAIQSIAITTPPIKTYYNPNETLDLTGIVVTATAGTLTKDVTSQCTFSPANGTVLIEEGTFTLTATYESLTATTTYRVQTLVMSGWADGTDEEISALLRAHYNGDIDLHTVTGWEIGASRLIELSAMSATGVGESHTTQTVEMVLMNKGGKTLADGVTECAFIVGQRDCLASSPDYKGGYINNSATNVGGWRDCKRRIWCNSVYYNAFPSVTKSWFKQFINQTAEGGTSSTLVDTIDYFALPSESEVTGLKNNAMAIEGSQFEFYITSSNRGKALSYGSQQRDAGWWKRSPSEYNATKNYFCMNTGTSTTTVEIANKNEGISPFGCI